MKIYYTDDLLLGLYSLLTQIELSIHRGIDNWTDLNIYFHEKGIRTTIDKILRSNEGGKYQIKIHFLKRCYYSIRKKKYISDFEWAILVKLLNEVNALLDTKIPHRDKEIELRMKIYSFSMIVRGRLKLDKTILCLADRVEHFYENEHCVHYSINQIIATVNHYMKCNNIGSVWENIN
ncbi:hypothetical protein [Citrobacter werkmanii]|uniref:hypothetical protein n=1 Tax=Citrobacter werkmanii TaxID=67827 RepID=UPI0009A21111|nr:hypothetical protein [Citrobacter werkmanii]